MTLESWGEWQCYKCLYLMDAETEEGYSPIHEFYDGQYLVESDENYRGAYHFDVRP